MLRNGDRQSESALRWKRFVRWAAAVWCAVQVAGTGVRLDAGDWPQLLGPQRNGHAVGETLPERFPTKELTPKFRHALGAGFAGPAVVDGRVLVFHRIDDHEVLEALDAQTGAPLWKTRFPTDYQGGYSADTGPRCVPLVHEGRVYVFGASGHLHCVALADGKQIWSRALAKEYRAPEGYFGIGSTPIVAGDKLLVALGGRDGAGIVALDRATGKTLWKATDEQVSYASPIRAELAGTPYYLFLTRLNLLAIDPENGEIQFRHPFGKSGLTVTGATPIAFDDRVLLTASYGIGAEVVKVGPGGEVRSLWANDETLSSQYASGVFVDGYVYGTHGREDGPPSELRCVDPQTGTIHWATPGVGVAHLIAAGDRLLVQCVESGELLLVEATPRAYTELDRRDISDEVLRALPALAGGMLYLRTTNERTNQGELLVLPLATR